MVGLGAVRYGFLIKILMFKYSKPSLDICVSLHALALNLPTKALKTKCRQIHRNCFILADYQVFIVLRNLFALIRDQAYT